MKMLLEKLVFLAPIALGGLIPIVSISPVLATGTNIGCLSNLSCSFGPGGGGTVTVGDFVFSGFAQTASTGDGAPLWDALALSVSGSASPVLTFLNNEVGNLLLTGTYTLEYSVTNSTNNINSATLSSFDSSNGNTGSFQITDGPLPDSSITVTNTFNIGDPGGGEGTFSSFANSYQAVPLETDALPLVGATALFAGAAWWKQKRGKKAVISEQLSVSSEQSSDARD